MSDYDFSNLNDKEFESLANDVLSSSLNVRIERFKTGRDGGVDGRFFSGSHEVIIQSKHWIKSGIEALLRSLEKTESFKVKALKPNRYIFVTSLPLSRSNKIRIHQIFSPYITSESDIWGAEDLNDFISKNPDIENKHYNLWINSTNVINRMLNNVVIGRSEDKLNEIVDNSKKYIVTTAHHEALSKIEKSNALIITGSPGIGKTTLADELSKYYSAKGYEFYYIEDTIRDAECVYNNEKEQVFYYDDFLGRNFLTSFENNKGSHIINFIKRVRKDNKKKFILTTRTNIFNQGKQLSELFEREGLQKEEFEISVSNISIKDKAKILYNHIWFSDLSEIYINEFYKDKRYLSIIKHKNFNPRLISFITQSNKVDFLDGSQYWSYITKTLENPKDIWKHVFEQQTNDICRHLTNAIVIHGGHITETSLKETFKRILGSKLHPRIDISFESTIRLLTGALLNSSIIMNKTTIFSLYNPSIADYVLSNYIDNEKYIAELALSLRTKQSIKNLKNLFNEKIISERDYIFIIHEIMNRLIKENDTKPDEYTLNLILTSLHTSPVNIFNTEYLESVSKNILNTPNLNHIYDYLQVIYILLINNFILNTDSRLDSIIEHCLDDDDLFQECFIPLSNIINTIHSDNEDLINKTKHLVYEYLCENITSLVIDESLYDDIYSHDYDEGIDDTEVKKLIKRELDGFPFNFTDEEIIEIQVSCDFSEIIDYNITSVSNNYSDVAFVNHRNDSESDSVNFIEDYFERT